MKSIKCITNINELVVVWSVCSACACTVNERFLWPQLFMQRFMLLPQMLQEVLYLVCIYLALSHIGSVQLPEENKNLCQ